MAAADHPSEQVHTLEKRQERLERRQERLELKQERQERRAGETPAAGRSSIVDDGLETIIS